MLQPGLRLGVGAHIKAVEPGRLRHRRKQDREILVLLSGWIEAAVDRTALDMVIGNTVADSSKLVSGALVGQNAGQPRERLNRRADFQKSVGKILEFATRDL